MKNDSKMWKQLGVAMAVGSQFIGSIVTGILIGWLIDDHFSIAPMGLLVGSFLGLGVGVRWLIQYQKQIQQ